MPKWFVFVGPISVTVAQFFAPWLVQSSIKYLGRLRILTLNPTPKQLTDKNIHIAVHSFFTSLIILLVVSYIYMKFTPAIAEWASWVVIGLCFILLAFASLKPDMLINKDDFGEKSGVQVISSIPQRLQLKSWWNKLRVIVAVVSWVLALFVYLSYIPL